MTTSAEYRELREVPPDELTEWIRRRYPSGRPVQWWLSVIESLETELAKVARFGDDPVNVLAFAECILDLAVLGTGQVLEVCFWRLRLASILKRFDGAFTNVPFGLTPSSAARIALSNFSFSKDEIRSAGNRRNSELFGDGRQRITRSEMWLVQDFEKIICEMDILLDGVDDTELMIEFREWFAVYREIAPP